MKALFGEEIAQGVKILSKVIAVYDEFTGEVKEKTRIDDDDYFQRIKNAPECIRRIKLCDRLDNLNTMTVWDEARQRRYLIETERYILPIARMTDEELAQVIKREISKYYSSPLVYAYNYFECKTEPVV